MVPDSNAQEAALVPKLTVLSASSLQQLVALLKQGPVTATDRQPSHPSASSRTPDDTPEDVIVGQPVARTALALAAAGGHHLLMVGPPGCGKTLLARQLPRLLPPLSRQESLEVSRVQSVAGVLAADEGLEHLLPDWA